MQKLKAIFILIRFPNLVFIFLTQILAHFLLIQPQLISQQNIPVLAQGLLLLFAFSTVLIAAAGYMINDYFDIGIDSINKPERVTIEKIFKRRSIIIWHILLNFFALAIAGYIAFHFVLLRVLIFQFLSIFLLVVYSTTFKRKLLIGNLIISILTGMTLLSLAFYENSFPLFNLQIHAVKMYWLYICFACMITLCREIVKDIEDIKGDGIQHCKTIPLVWGISVAKNIVTTLFIFLTVLIMIVIFRYMHGNTIGILYWLLFVIAPLVFAEIKLRKATNAYHFHTISSLLKIITLAGILSMLFI